jgi:hypothetical protein
VAVHIQYVLSDSHLDAQLDYSASILAILSRFRYDISSFNGAKVHSLTNVMTMQRDIHDAFDRLECYLEATVIFGTAIYSVNHTHWVPCPYSLRRIVMKSNFSVQYLILIRSNSSRSQPAIQCIFQSPHPSCLPCMLLAARLLTFQVLLST